MSNSVRPHRQQPTRLPRPWDSPGKNTGVGFHFLLQCMKVKSESEVAQSCPTLCDPMDCHLPGSSVHGIFQARVLEWGAIALSNANIRILNIVPESSQTNLIFLKTFFSLCFTLWFPLLCLPVHWSVPMRPLMFCWFFLMYFLFQLYSSALYISFILPTSFLNSSLFIHLSPKFIEHLYDLYLKLFI